MLLVPPRHDSVDQTCGEPIGFFPDVIEPTQLHIERSRNLGTDIVFLSCAVPWTNTVQPIDSVQLDARIIVHRGDGHGEHTNVTESLDQDDYLSIGTLSGMLEIIARSLQAEIPNSPRPTTRRPRRPNSMSESCAVPTPRELTILSLVKEGKSDREIAELLVLSKRTVQFHLRNLFNKADVKSRTALVRQAAHLQWDL